MAVRPRGFASRWSLLKLDREAGIGGKLRLAREARGIALRDISDQTRISMRYLEAIESHDFKRLPGGIFNRSFVRAYARQVGYDEVEAVEEYASLMREQGEDGEDSSMKPFKSLVYTDGSDHHRSPLVTVLLAILILAALSLSVWAVKHFYERRIAPRATPTDTNRRVPLLNKMTVGDGMDSSVANALNVCIVKEGDNGIAV
jgi:cytoskeletal protein RodZ